MDEKRSRTKRSSRAIDEGYWDCSVCTYKNSPEAFKCEMCDVRKGTSTRKPRLNPQMVAQQAAQQYALPAPKKEKKGHKNDSSPGSSSSGKKRIAKLKNIDRSSGQSMEVTVGNVTVVITDYKPKERRISTDSSSQKAAKAAEATDSSNNTSLNSTHNDSSLKSEPMEDTGSVSVASETNGEISDEECS